MKTKKSLLYVASLVALFTTSSVALAGECLVTSSVESEQSLSDLGTAIDSFKEDCQSTSGERNLGVEMIRRVTFDPSLRVIQVNKNISLGGPQRAIALVGSNSLNMFDADAYDNTKVHNNNAAQQGFFDKSATDEYVAALNNPASHRVVVLDFYTSSTEGNPLTFVPGEKRSVSLYLTNDIIVAGPAGMSYRDFIKASGNKIKMNPDLYCAGPINFSPFTNDPNRDAAFVAAKPEDQANLDLTKWCPSAATQVVNPSDDADDSDSTDDATDSNDDSAEPKEEECGNRKDDDLDGLSDFKDPDCVGKMPNRFEGFDAPGIGKCLDADGDDVCDKNDTETTATDCADGLDNDGDGLIDANDTDCTTAADDAADDATDDATDDAADDAADDGTNPSTNDLDKDQDGDGFTPNQGDCDDTNAEVNPNAVEVCDDNIDNNCDNVIVDEEDLDSAGTTVDGLTCEIDPDANVTPGSSGIGCSLNVNSQNTAHLSFLLLAVAPLFFLTSFRRFLKKQS